MVTIEEEAEEDSLSVVEEVDEVDLMVQEIHLKSSASGVINSVITLQVVRIGCLNCKKLKRMRILIHKKLIT